MTATNHAMTGAIIGLMVSQPWLALPLAFLSHHILDALPHYGSSMSDEQLFQTRGFRNYLLVEALICFGVVLLLSFQAPTHWLLAAVCAFVAAAPDLYSLPRYLQMRAGKVYKPDWYARFSGDIQWFQRPIGAVVEVAWAIACGITLANLL